MTPSQLSEAVLRSVRGALAEGELELAWAAGAPAESAALRPAPCGAGHWATGIALRLAGPAGRPAPEVARVLRARLIREPGVRAVAVGGGGFLNITLAAGADGALLREILAAPRPPALPEDPARDVARWRDAAGGGDEAALLVQREANPLFLVRYAHARSRALQRAAAALRLRSEPGGHPAAYPHPGERAVLRLLGEYGQRAARPGWLCRLADALLAAEAERPTLPRGDEKPAAAHRARLALAEAAGLVLAGGLRQLGVSAPDHL